MSKRKPLPAPCPGATSVADEIPLDITPRAQLTLCDETIYLTRFDRGMPSATYPVQANHVAEAFSGLGGASSGLLPADALFFIENKGKIRIGVWLPPAVRSITFGTGRRKQVWRVPLPGCVFVGEGVSYNIYVALERPAAKSSQLYKAPLPNVHEDGHICAGNVKFTACSAATIHQAAALFFESEFNHDLAGGKITMTKKPKPARRRPNLPFYDGEREFADDEDEDDPDDEFEEDENADGAELIALLRSLDGKRVFPAKRLLPWCTLGELMKEE